MILTIDRWRTQFQERLRQQLPPGRRYDIEAQERYDAIMNLPVPSDDDLTAMQARGEMASDEELARDRRP